MTGEPWGCDNPTSALKHVVSVLLLLLLSLLLLTIGVLTSEWLLFDLLLLHIAHVTLVYLRLTHGLGRSEGHARARHLARLVGISTLSH